MIAAHIILRPIEFCLYLNTCRVCRSLENFEKVNYDSFFGCPPSPFGIHPYASYFSKSIHVHCDMRMKTNCGHHVLYDICAWSEHPRSIRHNDTMTLTSRLTREAKNFIRWTDYNAQGNVLSMRSKVQEQRMGRTDTLPMLWVCGEVVPCLQMSAIDTQLSLSTTRLIIDVHVC